MGVLLHLQDFTAGCQRVTGDSSTSFFCAFTLTFGFRITRPGHLRPNKGAYYTVDLLTFLIQEGQKRVPHQSKRYRVGRCLNYARRECHTTYTGIHHCSTFADLARTIFFVPSPLPPGLAYIVTLAVIFHLIPPRFCRSHDQPPNQKAMQQKVQQSMNFGAILLCKRQWPALV